MKKLLFALLFIAFSLFLNASNPKKQAIHTINDYKTFVSYWFEYCKATSAFGSHCFGSCLRDCNCVCSAGIFTCECSCICDEEQNQALMQTINPGAKSNWIRVKSIVHKEKTDIAIRLAQRIMDLYELGLNNKAKEYNELAKVMDNDIKNLKLKTLRKIASAFS